MSNQANPGMLTEQVKQSIINVAQWQMGNKNYKMDGRRVQVVLIHGQSISMAPGFFSGWASGTTGHWGLVVGGSLHHVVFKLDQDKNPVGVELQGQSFDQEWIEKGKATKEDIGTTSLSLEDINAIGESLISLFGDYKRLYLNSQAFADIFIQIVCDVECKDLSLPDIQNVTPNRLLAFPLTYQAKAKQQKVLKVIKKPKKAVSWEDVVDAEINDEISKMELDVVMPQPGCFLM